MSRLIDIEEAIKSFEEYDTFMGEPLTEREVYLIECVLALFDNQPTAYNLEAVVRELETESKLYSLSDSDCEFAIPMHIATAIVKRGGRDE